MKNTHPASALRNLTDSVSSTIRLLISSKIIVYVCVIFAVIHQSVFESGRNSQ